MFICLIWGWQFYGLFGTLLPALLRARRPREHGKIMKIHWFLEVESHLRLFRATPETTEFQRRGVAKTDQKPMPNKYPTRPEYTHKKRHFRCQNCYFLEPKIVQKTPWKPRARASTFRDLKNRFPSALGGSPGPKKAENKTLGAIFLSHRYPPGIRPVSGRYPRGLILPTGAPGDGQLSKNSSTTT